MKRNQSGFTLIEIAIVLVIIGLLLGGVLKGQELINSAKVKNLANDFKNIPVYIYGYQDKYKVLPGDDNQVVAHLGASAIPCGATVANKCSPGNGLIEGPWNATTLANESYVFWQHIRLADLAPGSTDTSAGAMTTYIPTNAVGGIIGLQSGTTDVALTPIKDNAATPAAIRGAYIICSAGILGKFAKQLDAQLDDGVLDTGSMMATLTNNYAPGNSAVTTAAFDEAKTYNVCMGV
jgi:prepilin-type N-terminal cleavage/methylation domain-containing protein